jgi:hypothetical protein
MALPVKWSKKVSALSADGTFQLRIRLSLFFFMTLTARLPLLVAALFLTAVRDRIA